MIMYTLILLSSIRLFYLQAFNHDSRIQETKRPVQLVRPGHPNPRLPDCRIGAFLDRCYEQGHSQGYPLR